MTCGHLLLVFLTQLITFGLDRFKLTSRNRANQSCVVLHLLDSLSLGAFSLQAMTTLNARYVPFLPYAFAPSL